MADSFCNLEDEAFPSFLYSSLGSASGRATLGNLTLGSGMGLPVAASTVAKIRAGADNRGNAVEASYLDGGPLSLANSQSSTGGQAKFALSFKDDLDDADDFIAAHRFSDMLVKVDLDETESRARGTMLGLPTTQTGSLPGRPTELGTDLSTGLLTFTHLGHKDTPDAKSVQAPPLSAAAAEEEDSAASEGADSDRYSGSVSSFLANEKLMSVDSMNSDITDDDIDVNDLPDDELELYFNKLVPPGLQRGRVEGQEIPAAGLPGAPDSVSNPGSTEPEKNRYQFLDGYDQEDFQMPDVRLAATGMDSCPASDEEDTEDELEAARRHSNGPRSRLLLPSTSRQLVGESNRPSFRPGLEGGSSDDEPFNGGGASSLSGIEHRRSAEGQVINSPVTGDGGGGDGSSGSEDSGNDGGVSTIPLPPPPVQTTYDVLRGLGIVGSSSAGEDGDNHLNSLPGLGRNSLSRHAEMGDRVGPVGTGEASSSSGGPQRLSPVNWSMSLDRQVALDAMDSTESGPAAELDSPYLRNGAGHWRTQDTTNATNTHLQGRFHLSQMVLPDCGDDDDDDEDEGVDEADSARPSLGLRGGPCGDATVAQPLDSNGEDDHNLLSTSLEAKYFSQSFHQEVEDSDDGWNYRPDNLELEFQQGANAADSVVYQNEEGKWVTDLAYYSSFEKEVDTNVPESVEQFQTEDFVPASNAIQKIIEDQEEFEKEHQFMQEEQIEAASDSPGLADSSWRLPSNSHILMRASQVSSEFERGNQSYLRLSLGQFFEQRSEALGCLGTNHDEDWVKRPSFGYIITSPEKREPFPLISLSDFSSRDTSAHNDTVELSQADKTLNPEDLDKTIEAPGDRMSPKGDTDPGPGDRMSPKGDTDPGPGDRMSPKGDTDPGPGDRMSPKGDTDPGPGDRMSPKGDTDPGPGDRMSPKGDTDPGPGDRMSPKGDTDPGPGDRMSPKGDTDPGPGDRMSPKGDTDPGPGDKEDGSMRTPLPEDTKGAVTASGSANQSCISPHNSSQLMLSISTIASAIADASINSDPSQLAAMIMELSKRSRAKNHPRPAGPASTTTSTTTTTEEPASGQNSQPQVEQTALLDALQKSLCAGEVSAFDIEKYLRKADVSGCSHSSSDVSGSHSTFNLTGWADDLNNSQDGAPVVVTGSSAQQVEDRTRTQSQERDTNEDCKVNDCSTATSRSVSGLNASSSFNKGDSRRSFIPRSKARCLPTASSRRSVGTGQSSTIKPSTDCKADATAKTTALDGKASTAPKPDSKTAGPSDRNSAQNGAKLGTLHPQVSTQSSLKTLQTKEDSLDTTPACPKTSPGQRKERSGLPCLKSSSPPSQRNTGQQRQERPCSAPEKRPVPRSPVAAPSTHSNVEKHVGFSCQTPQPPAHHSFEVFKSSLEQSVAATEDSQCNFRPSTSPLTHSSPSQTSFPSADGTMSPPSSPQPGCQLSPQSTCSSPSLSRLTYISMNDRTVLPTPDRHQSNSIMALSTTIIRASPTPPMESDTKTDLDILGPSKSLDQLQPHQSKSLDPLPPPHQCKSPEPPYCSNRPDLRSGSALSCTRSQSECNHCCGRNGTDDLLAGYRQHKCHHESGVRQLTKVDSGYSSNLNIQQPIGTIAGHSSQQWGAAGSMLTQVTEAYPGGGFGMPPSYSSEDLRCMPIFSFKPPGPGRVDMPHHGGMPPSLLTGRSLFSSQLAHHYSGSEAPLHPGTYHTGATGNGLYTVSSTGMSNGEAPVRHLHNPAGPLAGPGPVGLSAGYHQLHRPHQNQLDLGMMGMGKPFIQPSVGPWVGGGLEELRGQVVVPEELRFPHACCVGIASQTSLSIFNPSERWQQVSITVTSLAIDGEKVDSIPFQWLIVKNKTIIGPKSTEEQKLLLVPPQAGVYRFVLSVSSWPASAETEVAARAQVFAKSVVLVAVAENPALEVDAGQSGCLDFGDLSGGSAKALPLKLLNRTHATVPIRLVISANATAWRCFTFSKSPVTMTAEGTVQAGHMTPLSAPSVMNHVMHASYGESSESYMVWVHFQAPQKYTSSAGELGPADEYSARVDIEVDCPGPSHVIRSIPLRARSGTARVHAPKDLQTVSLSAALGKSSQQTLPLKNAGNIDVQLKLKSSDGDCFSVKPEDLLLRAGEEQGIVVLFSAQGSRKIRESVLTILVLPSGPQYEVSLRGEVVPEDCGIPASASVPPGAPGMAGQAPPILSNKQFMAWGGVTLGRAVQQKLVLRNNSPSTTQQLRLLIRGQDQDCFQLQSMFSPEERLTRHGELSIRPREDVAVHLLFAPTRVACMLAKLEIKQSGVRPSQPGVKFTIPLSGYGGTSNIILEDQRKRADGYVATLPGIGPGRVSKACLCVRNTGSRAAFIKAMAYSDIQTRSVMEPTVISLSPSQFVLKERTQEVITVLMKSTEREQAVCQSASAILATVCLFTGDEVSRQQYRRLLQGKPEAGKKVLSENSLLKNIEFNERFLGEEQVTEAYDLPQRPNEAQLFYGNMSKVVVSLLGTTDTSDTGESDHIESRQVSVRHGSETDSGSGIGNVSLDVLPVKGPQGPALRVPETPLKAAESSGRQQESWSLHPEQLVLTAPTINGASNTQQVQIQNLVSRELSFELSWPAHCLTITPQHGLIEPQCHLQILISPNPSLATKPALLPWTGKIYVQCDNQQKFIKVQIRRDLALDVSAAPADRTLAALSPQVATPLLPVVRPQAKTSQPPHTPLSPQAPLEIRNKTIIFPATPSGETSESQLEVENYEEEVRWYLSSFAPPYVKGVDNSGDVYRATYTAFRCSRVSGTLGAREKMQVPITFLPRDRGDYAQFWDLECHPVAEPQQKTRIRFQLCGTGVKSGPMEEPQEGDCSLVKTEASGQNRKRYDASALKTRQEEAPQRGVYCPQDQYTFPDTRVGESSSLKVNVRNNSSDTHELKFLNPREPFHIKHSKYSLRSQHYLKLPVQFKPSAAGRHSGLLLIQSETSGSLVIQLTAEALP